jgi:hypothetical protein
VAGLLGDPGAVRVGGHAREIHDARFDFDEEQNATRTPTSWAIRVNYLATARPRSRACPVVPHVNLRSTVPLVEPSRRDGGRP